jgi:Zn-dependent protease
MPINIDPQAFVLRLLAIIISLSIHEFAHAKSAELAGDPTPRAQGRITLNPIAHLDPLGTLLILLTMLSGYGIGWGKPVEVNPGNFRKPRLDFVLVAAWGPLSNVILATLCATLLRTAGGALPDLLLDFLVYMVVINIVLAVFNMIPLHPLDGSKVLSGFLRDFYDRKYWRFQMTYGSMILFGSIMILPWFGFYPLSYIIRPMVRLIGGWLLGSIS